MKRSKFADAQIASILQQANEGTSVAGGCRKAEIAEATFYNWRKKFAGLMPSEIRRLKQLERPSPLKLGHFYVGSGADNHGPQALFRRRCVAAFARD